MRKKIITKTISFTEANKELFEYAEEMGSGKGFTAAVLECIACHKHLKERGINWRTVSEVPRWAQEILDHVKGAH